MREYLEDYETQINDFKHEVRQKDDIISKLKNGDLNRLESLQATNADIDEDFEEEFKLHEEHLELKEKLSSVIYSSQEETQHLKKNLDFANLKIHEIRQLYREDQEKYQIIEEELKILKTHFYAIEKEKGICEQKLKTMQFKKDSLAKDILIYKKNNDEMEDTIDKLEKK